jgi:ankyrin repeat protein
MTDEKQNTLLHIACEVEMYLLTTTQTHYTKAGHLFIVNFLFECGARLHLTNAAGETPIQVAQRSGHTEIARMLIEEDAKERFSGCRLFMIAVCHASLIAIGTIHRACASGRILSALRFYHTMQRCNVPNQEGHSPMFLAVNNNQPLVVSVLLEAGISATEHDFQVIGLKLSCHW